MPAMQCRRGTPSAVRVFDGLRHAGAELVLAAGDAGDAALARGPVARRQVVQHQLQPVRLQSWALMSAVAKS